MAAIKPLNAVAREEKVQRCPECQSTEIEYQEGERYCKKCGLVIE